MNGIEIDENDIFFDALACLYRQRTDIPFTPDNITNIEMKIPSPGRIGSALAKLMKEEAREAAMHPFAWNPEFGYVTSMPMECGTGLDISALMHLEGLHLMGDLEPVMNALEGMRMMFRGCNGDGLRNAAHIFRIRNAYSLGLDEHEIAERVKRIFRDLIRQEVNARLRLVYEFPRVFEDAIARSLAILRSCRLLSNFELVDLISPLRLAANLDLLRNFTRKEAVEIMITRIDRPATPSPNSYDEQREMDRRDAALADKANRRFRNVCLNDMAKDILS